MKIDFEGEVRTLDLARVRLGHARAIQEFTGLTAVAWQERLSVTGSVTQADFNEDPAGALSRVPMFADPEWIVNMAAAHWLMLAQAGEDPPPLDGDWDPDVLGFGAAYIAAFLGDLKAKRAKRAPGEPDPTAPPGRPARSSRRTAPKKPKAEASPAPSPSTGS